MTDRKNTLKKDLIASEGVFRFHKKDGVLNIQVLYEPFCSFYSYGYKLLHSYYISQNKGNHEIKVKINLTDSMFFFSFFFSSQDSIAITIILLPQFFGE